MNIPKLDEFTAEELKTVHIAIDMYMRQCAKVVTDNEREILNLWLTQIMNATVEVKMREKLHSN